MSISVAADERTGVAEAVVRRAAPARARADRARRAERRGARRLGLGQRGGGPRRGRGPRRAGDRLLLDRHRRLDRRQQGARASARRSAPTPRPPAARAGGTTRTCWRCRCARTSEALLEEILDALVRGHAERRRGRRGEHPPRGRDRLAERVPSSPWRSQTGAGPSARKRERPSRRPLRPTAAKLPGTSSGGHSVLDPVRVRARPSRPRSTLAPSTGRPRRFTVTLTVGVRLVAFGGGS